MNMSGARPEGAFHSTEPVFPKQVCFVMKFSSTYEAIEKLVLPPPLKVDRTLTPEVIVWYFTSPESRGPGGQIIPYQGFQFRAHAQYNGSRGIAGWEYVDGLYGDKTVIDIMGPWGVQFGMMKKSADIRFSPIGGDEFEIVVARHGCHLFRITIGNGQKLDDVELDQLLHASDNPMKKDTFTVREIPNCDWDGYLDQSVLFTPTSKSIKVNRAWHASGGTIEFSHLGSDPLHELRPSNVHALFICEIEVGRATFKEMKEVQKC